MTPWVRAEPANLTTIRGSLDYNCTLATSTPKVHAARAIYKQVIRAYRMAP